MDIAAIISANLTAWMATTPALDTLQKLEARSGIGFGTIRRAKNGDGNITAKSIAAIAEAFGRTPSELITPPGVSEAPASPSKVLEPAIDAVEHHARMLVEQSAEVARRWIALPPGRRDDFLAALRAESGEAAIPGEGRSLPTPRRKPGLASSSPLDTKGRQADG